MTDIHERIKLEYAAMHTAIFPSERAEHAEKIAELEKELNSLVDKAWDDYMKALACKAEYTESRHAREDGE